MKERIGISIANGNKERILLIESAVFVFVLVLVLYKRQLRDLEGKWQQRNEDTKSALECKLCLKPSRKNLAWPGCERHYYCPDCLKSILYSLSMESKQPVREFWHHPKLIIEPENKKPSIHFTFPLLYGYKQCVTCHQGDLHVFSVHDVNFHTMREASYLPRLEYDSQFNKCSKCDENLTSLDGSLTAWHLLSQCGVCGYMGKCVVVGARQVKRFFPKCPLCHRMYCSHCLCLQHPQNKCIRTSEDSIRSSPFWINDSLDISKRNTKLLLYLNGGYGKEFSRL
jgi:hypothetical protein